MIGVLALQGDVREHRRALGELGVESIGVKKADALDEIDGLIIPGGESTTIGRLATLYGLIDPLRKRIADGLPTFGTCAGLILLARAVTEGTQPLLGLLNVEVRRNAFGNQNDSFEADLEVSGLDDPFRAVFIRAPWVEEVGSDVEVLSSWADHPVMVRQGNIMASAFHPELTDDTRVHAMLVDMIEER